VPGAYKRSYADNGYALIENRYTSSELEQLSVSLKNEGVFSYSFANAESHNLIKSSQIVRHLAFSKKLLPLAHSIVGLSAIPFHAIVLDKTKKDNWGLDWHQDIKITVKKRIATEGYEQWTEESGILHVVPPAHVLTHIVMLRIHLDDCNESNGAVWAIPGSHKFGILPQAAIQTTVKQGTITPCCITAGGVMLMSPLLLHKSPYSLSDRSRRILQITYRKPTRLDNGLEWHD
jgi:ectoine hydroxylase-related dioxygenase (phytanoyl-CoA dioxygenase family)